MQTLFEATKGVIRRRKLMNSRQSNDQMKKWKRTKGQTTIYKTHHTEN